jgi:hypothetical protein
MSASHQIKFAQAFIHKAKSSGFTAQEAYRILKSANWFEDNFRRPLMDLNDKLTPASINPAAPTLPLSARQSSAGKPPIHHVDSPARAYSPPAQPPTPTPTPARTQLQAAELRYPKPQSPAVPTPAVQPPPAAPAANTPHPVSGTAAVPHAQPTAPNVNRFLPRVHGAPGWAGAAAGTIGALDMMGNRPEGMSPTVAAGVGATQLGLGAVSAYQATRPGAWSNEALREATRFARPGAAALTHAGLLGTAGLAIGGMTGDFGPAKQHWNKGNYMQAAGSALNQFARPLYEPIVHDFQQGHPVRGVMRAGELAAPFFGPIGVAASMGLGAVNAGLDFKDHYNQTHGN